MLNESDGMVRVNIAFARVMRSTNERAWSLCVLINPELTESQDPEGPSRVTAQGDATLGSRPPHALSAAMRSLQGHLRQGAQATHATRKTPRPFILLASVCLLCPLLHLGLDLWGHMRYV